MLIILVVWPNMELKQAAAAAHVAAAGELDKSNADMSTTRQAMHNRPSHVDAQCEKLKCAMNTARAYVGDSLDPAL